MAAGFGVVMMETQTPDVQKIWAQSQDVLLDDIKKYFSEKYSQKILNKFQSRIQGLVGRYYSKLPSHVTSSEADDLANVARIEFFETIKQWDPVKSLDIWPLAYSRITGAMKDHIRYLTKADPSRVYDWVNTAAYLYQSVENNNTFETKIENGVTLNTAMHELSAKERFIVIGRYRDDKTFKELGQKVGVSESQATRIYKGAIDTLKKTIAK
jgi:RNA polymerase sigma factor (sigma-70 family)